MVSLRESVVLDSFRRPLPYWNGIHTAIPTLAQREQWCTAAGGSGNACVGSIDV